MNALQTSLSKCRVDGNTLFLPEEYLDNYAEVRKVLIQAGGTYNKNKFVFKSDAQPFIDRLLNGSSVNIKKEFQFFETPDDVADYMVRELYLRLYTRPRVLEPSAGQGALVKALYREYPEHKQIDCCELMPENRDVLECIDGVHIIADDFLSLGDEYNEYYDLIIANPPFAKNQDIDHVYKMWDCLKPGGRIVTVMSPHWEFSSRKKEKTFQAWLEEKGGAVYPLGNGRFKSSGTMVSSVVVILDK